MERSSTKSVTFAHPFHLRGIERLLEPGTYEIDTIEEQIDGLTFIAYRRLSTTVTLEDPATQMRQVIQINADDFAAAQIRDMENRNG